MAEAERDTEEHLRARVAELEAALESRIVIEQAKGLIAGRHHVDLQTAFDALRLAARSNHLILRELALRVIVEPGTPHEIAQQLSD